MMLTITTTTTTSILVFTALYLCVAATSQPQTAHLSPLLGVAPELLDRYKGQTFSCLNGSNSGEQIKAMPIALVNDDYCDCPDGSDEPGTSACSNGQFYCANKGHKPMIISSMLVNDGVCDCCDGSDEYLIKINCPNTCKELGAELRKIHAERVNTYAKGLKLKDKMVHEAKKMMSDKLQELETLKSELDPLEQLIAKYTRQRDRLAKKQRQEMQRQDEEEDRKNSDAAAAAPAPAASPDQEAAGIVEPVPKAAEEQPQKEQTTKQDQEHDKAENMDDEEEEAEEHAPGWFKMLPKGTRQVLKTLGDYVTPLSTLAKNYLPVQLGGVMTLDDVNDALETARRDLTEKKERIESIEKLMKEDLGKDNVFLPLYRKCFESKTKEYTYTLCPYDRATQGSTNLGSWEQWRYNYTEMMFKDGQQCWGGPKRSLLVNVECGLENEAWDVQEPSKCEYTIRFKTPAVCNEQQYALLLKDQQSDDE